MTVKYILSDNKLISLWILASYKKICFNSPKEADVKLSIYGIEPSSGTLSNKLGYINHVCVSLYTANWITIVLTLVSRSEKKYFYFRNGFLTWFSYVTLYYILLLSSINFSYWVILIITISHKDYTFHKFLCTFFHKIKCCSGSEMINCGYMSLSDWCILWTHVPIRLMYSVNTCHYQTDVLCGHMSRSDWCILWTDVPIRLMYSVDTCHYQTDIFYGHMSLSNWCIIWTHVPIRLMHSVDDNLDIIRLLCYVYGSLVISRLLYSVYGNPVIIRLLYSVDGTMVTIRLMHSVYGRVVTIRLLFYVYDSLITIKLLVSVYDNTQSTTRLTRKSEDWTTHKTLNS